MRTAHLDQTDLDKGRVTLETEVETPATREAITQSVLERMKYGASCKFSIAFSRSYLVLINPLEYSLPMEIQISKITSIL